MSKPENKTLVTFLLDETGSMASIIQPTLDGFNSYLSTLKEENDASIDFTLIKFDSTKLEKVCVAVPVHTVPNLNSQTYRPGAMTPLVDAAYKTIKAVEKSLAEMTVEPKIVICIQTDGHENASSEHTWAELNALIKEKTKAGWQFNFLGSGIDAYDTGAKMGVAAVNTMSSGLAPEHVRASFGAMAMSATNYASGRSATANVSMAARVGSGDMHFHKYGLGGNASISGKQAELDLGCGGPASVTPATPAPPEPVKVVDDFIL